MIIPGELYRFTSSDWSGQLFVPVRELEQDLTSEDSLWECMCNGSLRRLRLHPSFYERVEEECSSHDMI